MQLTRMLSGPHSTAKLRANCMSAALEMLYAPMTAEPCKPPTDETNTMAPSFLAFMSG